MKKSIFKCIACLLLFALSLQLGLRFIAPAVNPADHTIKLTTITASTANTAVLSAEDHYQQGGIQFLESSSAQYVPSRSIESFNTWDELVNYVVRGNYDPTIFTDQLIHIILSIDSIGYTCNGFTYGGIRMESFSGPDGHADFEATIEHFISLYNAAPDRLLYLTVEFTMTANSEYLMFTVDYDEDNIKYPVWYLGQVAYIAAPTHYYESSHGGGSGLSAPASRYNPLLGEDMLVIVNGVSYLDENNHCVLNKYIAYNSANEYHPIDLEWNNRMFHITTLDGVDLGWVPSSVLVPSEALSLTVNSAV